MARARSSTRPGSVLAGRSVTGWRRATVTVAEAGDGVGRKLTRERLSEILDAASERRAAARARKRYVEREMCAGFGRPSGSTAGVIELAKSRADAPCRGGAGEVDRALHAPAGDEGRAVLGERRHAGEDDQAAGDQRIAAWP